MKWSNKCINCGQYKQYIRQRDQWVHSGTLSVKCDGIKPQRECQ